MSEEIKFKKRYFAHSELGLKGTTFIIPILTLCFFIQGSLYASCIQNIRTASRNLFVGGTFSSSSDFSTKVPSIVHRSKIGDIFFQVFGHKGFKRLGPKYLDDHFFSIFPIDSIPNDVFHYIYLEFVKANRMAKIVWTDEWVLRVLKNGLAKYMFHFADNKTFPTIDMISALLKKLGPRPKKNSFEYDQALVLLRSVFEAIGYDNLYFDFASPFIRNHLRSITVSSEELTDNLGEYRVNQLSLMSLLILVKHRSLEEGDIEIVSRLSKWDYLFDQTGAYEFYARFTDSNSSEKQISNSFFVNFQFLLKRKPRHIFTKRELKTISLLPQNDLVRKTTSEHLLKEFIRIKSSRNPKEFNYAVEEMTIIDELTMGVLTEEQRQYFQFP